MSVLKKPDLTDPKLRAKLAKGMGHNYYGEPAWPNDLLYMFPVVILGTLGCMVGLSVLSPSPLGEKADPFATPLEILPEWYFFPTFNLLRVIPNKLLGVLPSLDRRCRVAGVIRRKIRLAESRQKKKKTMTKKEWCQSVNRKTERQDLRAETVW